MRLILSTLTLLSAFAISSIAAADTIVPFTFNASLLPGTVSGTVDVDTTNGTIGFTDFTVSILGTNYLFNTTPFIQGPVPSPPTLYRALFKDASNHTFQLALPLTSLVGYMGSAICSESLTCYDHPPLKTSVPSLFVFSMNPIHVDAAESGSLTPASPVPEPSSLALLSTGLLGAGGAARKRFVKA